MNQIFGISGKRLSNFIFIFREQLAEMEEHVAKYKQHYPLQNFKA